MDQRVRRGDIREDQVTSYLEQRTAQAPSSSWLGAAVCSMIVSLGLKLSGKNHAALFVGQWAAPFLLMGIYNKMVKLHGSDASFESQISSAYDRSEAA